MTIIRPDWLLVAADQAPRRGWSIRVDGGVVDTTGPHVELAARYPDDEIVDAAGHVVLPGFVDAHTHLYGVLAHGIPPPSGGGPTDFWSFLADYWWPLVEDALDIDMVVAATDHGCGEMLRSGITTFYDIVEAPGALPGVLDAQREVVERHGLRGLLSVEATERAGPEVARLALDENTRHLRASRDHELIGGLMCWHTTFTCSATYIREAAERARELGASMHCHLNEGEHEGRWAAEHLGCSTLEFYDRLGVAGPELLASQCVQLTPADRTVLAERGVRVSHMPLANCEVGGGIAPVPELVDDGVTVGLGTDGYIQDFFEVLRGAFLVHKARRRDPAVMDARLVLSLATEGGARALGLERVGRLEPGWAADLQVVDLDLPTPVDEHNLAEQLVVWRNRRHVRDVMVAGRWRVRGGEVIGTDLTASRQRVRAAARRLWERP